MNIKNKAVNVKNRLDISYCGEIPDKNVNLHYGYGMAKELRRISFIKIILQNSASFFWERIATVAKESSIIAKKLYSLSVQNVGIVIFAFFTLLLFIGVK